MPEYRPLAVERQVFLIGIWRSVTLNDIFLKEIQIEEEKITDKICQLQLSPSGLFLFAKTGNYNTGLENGVLLHKIYSIASKKSKPEHLLCIIDEDEEDKFAVILLRCNTLKDSFLIQNTMKELWDVCFMSEKQFYIKREPCGRVKSMLRGSYGSDESWQKSNSEKSDEIYNSGSLITIDDFNKYQHATESNMTTIREQLDMIFSEINNVKVYLTNTDITNEDNLEDLNNMKGMKYLRAIAHNKDGDSNNEIRSLEDYFDVDVLKASKLSDTENEEYILLRNNLLKKSHDGYFQEKPIRFKPDYLHSDPLFGKTRKGHSLEDCLNTKESNMVNSQMEIMESTSKANSVAKGRKPGNWGFLQELFDLESNSKESITKKNSDRTFTPCHAKPLDMAYMRTGVRKPIEEVYRKKDSQVFTWDAVYKPNHS
ncbi:Hypothetical predicted protein [Octopus vulgaris]|uniref:Uncharacterized protein n=2 Tax=Octopus TaxID=6643 RepID=A0AA36FS95_OCTVU|nr:uncharacterized protein LOC118762023 [Octopus sinensis]CAI9744473.1 Hypothetical predicted protein [Octopus vulgaris]